MHPAVPASLLGKLVDRRYRLERLVGEGASSWVFAATDQRLQREVALKLFKPPSNADDLKRRTRCVAEGRTLAKLVHPHIVAIHDASEDGSGQVYLVMELCEAGTLEAELALRGRLELSEALQLALPLMGALAFAHDRNIIHRDIKPGNIVLVEERGERRCKLLDFGISLGAGVGMSSDLALGTPAYMAPEQVRGEPTTPATDVWALGVVLFRCLAGRLPFEATSSAGMVLQIAQGSAPRLSSVCDARLAPTVMRALDRALYPELARRYGDMRSFARTLAASAVLDRVALVQRPEPIGLPDFDAWLLAARDSTTTAPLSVTTAESCAVEVPQRRRVPWTVKAALAAAITVTLAGGALALLSASERTQPAAVERPAATQRAPAGLASVRGQRPMEADATPQSASSEREQALAEAPPASGPEELVAPPPASEGPQAAARPVPAPEAARVAPVLALKRRARAEPRPPVAGAPAQPAAPRVIMSWDW